jgi:hypothetical protein
MKADVARFPSAMRIDSNLISDNLSDVPDDIFNESESDTVGGGDRE